MGRDAVHQPYINAAGQKVPSVTTIIGNNLGWNKNMLLSWTRKKMNEGIDPIRIRDFAGEVGTVAHGLVEQFFTGKLFNIYEYPAEAVTAAQVAYSAFEAFESKHELVMAGSEIPLVHEELNYGGTIDWLGTMDGDLCLIDFKTSSGIYPDHIIQLAAYRELYLHCTGEDLAEAHILHMCKRTGNPTFKTIRNFDRYWRIFKILLELNQLHSDIGE